MGHGTSEGCVDWKNVGKTLTFHMCLEVDTVNLDITARRLEDVVNTMLEKDPSTYDTYTDTVINAAKNENKSKEKDDYTLIGSTIKTYVKVYKGLGDKWINLTGNRVKKLGITYKSTKNKAGLNTMSLITALLKIK